MKKVLFLIIVIVLITGCARTSSNPDYSVGAGLEIEGEELVSIDSITINGKELKVREPTRLKNGIVTINGRLIIDGVDVKEKDFPKKCCYINAKSFKDCDCVYGIKTELLKDFQVRELE